MLPFDLRLAPKLFSTAADTTEWYVSQKWVQYIFLYLDDFIVLGPPDSLACENSRLILKQTYTDLGVPWHQQDGPMSDITFLGITVDRVRKELRLPPEKMERLVEAVSHWQTWRSITTTELETLIGVLQHAVIPGKTFLRRAITFSV